jgi:membrane associated rhomboid family serine protease
MVIPVHDINPLRRTPIVTYALIAANFVVFLLTPAVTSVTGSAGAADSCRQEAFFQHWAAIPRELVHNQVLALAATGQVAVDRTGAVGCIVAPRAYDKVPFLSALTSQFVHGSWLHLLGNMLFLLIFGNNVEDRFGRVRFLIFYLGCGVVAAYGFALGDPNSTITLVGASGAIAGVLGAYLMLFPRARVWSLLPFLFYIPLRLPAWLVLGSWFLLQWAYTSGLAVSTGDVAYLAHVYGFVAGALVALAVRAVTRGRGPRGPGVTRTAWG